MNWVTTSSSGRASTRFGVRWQTTDTRATRKEMHVIGYQIKTLAILAFMGLLLVLDKGLPAPLSMTRKNRRSSSPETAPALLCPLKDAGSEEARLPRPGRQIRVGMWYCREDELFAQRLRTHLQPAIRQRRIDLWNSERLVPGTLWQCERDRAVQSVSVAVLFLSADFLASDFLVQYELPRLFSRATTETIILLIHVSPCEFRGTGLEQFQAVNSPERPLVLLRSPGRESIFARTAALISQQLRA